MPGDDVLHEITLSAIHAEASQANRILVLGPGQIEQLPALLEACPNTDHAAGAKPTDALLLQGSSRERSWT